MRVFEHFNTVGAPCPICGTHEDKPTVLVAIRGTRNGDTCEALQAHIDCINLSSYRDGDDIIFAMVTKYKGAK